MSALETVLVDGDVRLEPLAAHHIELLRAACARDPDIWEIYPVSMLGEHFDRAMEDFHATTNWVRFAVLHRGVLVGMSCYIAPDESNHVVEIGGTYIEPAARGSAGVNSAIKRLMIDHAFACGFTRIEFRVDSRNLRSQAAVRKLGAMHEGTLRRNRITWTGYVRDTCMFGLLKTEWSGGRG
ncbi:MAG: GNAT family N-acetyltransferase [Blastomonas fulva]|jgi:RimJ/RimL family protein N-acetyltransferase|uniref:GNAT family N-acetyltransferase n=1 Tax=Blastomonas TaxID=150203 RepID=UPI0006B962E1|nr:MULTISPECIES: GNAT family protein [Blastomonas]AOG01744.1 acetyltransferase family protein [Blastomonas sp. RAC04]MDK2757082.1 GNAT family N-acetyltransferase [Blastomonas fulva]